jgi:integrase
MDNPHANGGAPFIQTACETLYSILDSSLKAKTASELIQASSGQEQALCVLLAATGMRVSEALAVETHHFTNEGRTIHVEQQVEKNSPRIVKYLKTAAAKRQVDLHADIAEYLQRYTAGKSGLLVPHSERHATSLRQLGGPLADSAPRQDGIG